MAEEKDDTEKTEDPTQKRLDEALKRGDVVKSQEVSTWFVITGATLVLIAFSGGVGSNLTATMRGISIPARPSAPKRRMNASDTVRIARLLGSSSVSRARPRSASA